MTLSEEKIKAAVLVRSPFKRLELIVQFGERWEVEVTEVADGGEVCLDLERLGRGETLDPGFFVWGRSKSLV